MTEFVSEHELDFLIAPFELNIDPDHDWMRFRIGTCDGVWCCTDDSYDILGITNNAIGNGHFNDVLQWFEQSCVRDGRSLRVLELWNKEFKRHLIEKRGFVDAGNDIVIKNFK